MSNRVTIIQFDAMTTEEVDAIPLDQLQLLDADLDKIKDMVKRLDAKFFKTMDGRYSAPANDLRKKLGKDTGTVRIDAGELVVITDLPKKVTWNQAEMRKAQAVLVGWGEDPAEYITTELKVSETKYTAWPSKIRDQFTPARTLAVGKATFSIEQRKEA